MDTKGHEKFKLFILDSAPIRCKMAWFTVVTEVLFNENGKVSDNVSPSRSTRNWVRI